MTFCSLVNSVFPLTFSSIILIKNEPFVITLKPLVSWLFFFFPEALSS